MTSKYTGHGARTGGLQGHSVGEVYPFIVFAQETPQGMLWGVMDGSTGESTGPIYRNAHYAQRCAVALKAGIGGNTIQRIVDTVSWLRHTVPARALSELV